MPTEHQDGNRTPTGQFPKGTSGNLKGRPRKLPDTFGGLTLDGWSNFISGLGDANFDKRLANRMCVKPVGCDEARAIYRGSDMGARLVEARVKEMWRPGFEITIKDLKGAKEDDLDAKLQPPVDTNAVASINRYAGYARDGKRRYRRDADEQADTDKLKQLAKRAERKFKKLRGKKRFREAQHYANAYGGGAILIGARDGSASWAKPLDVNRVRSVDFLTSLESRELTPIAWYEDPLADKFGEPMLYQITPVPESGSVSAASIIYVHESRLIVFDGVRVSRNMESVIPGFGDSCFTRVKQILSDFDMGFASIGILLQEISIACMKIKGLASAAANDEGRKKLFARLAAVAMAKSIANMTLIDADGEEFTRTNATVSGVADLLQILMQRVAAAFDMPVTVLMGMSPAGLNATGASDIRQWYDDIAAEREDKLDEPMTYLMGMILRTLNGGIEPADWCIEWGALYQQNPKEQAEIFLTYANADEKNVLNGFYTAQEVRNSRYKSGKFGTEIVIESDNDNAQYTPEEIADYKGAAGKPDPNAPVDPNAPPPDPNAQPPKPGAQPKPGAAPVMPSGGTDIQKTAMTGVQITAMIEIVKAVVAKEIPRESGIVIATIGLQMTEAEATKMMGPEDFKAPEPPPSPFGGGGPKPFGAPRDKGKPVDQSAPQPDKEKPPEFK